MMEFIYPIDYEMYSSDEIVVIVDFLNLIEKCYIVGVDLKEYKENYKIFKKVVTSKLEENKIFKEYEKITGYSGYLTTKEMKKGSKRIFLAK